MAGRSKQKRLFTIGHSNQSFEEFRSLLEEFQIRVIADVRRFPSSRKFPHFNGGTLRERLDAEGIQYVWFEILGGLRHTGKNEKTPNVGLKSPAFRNYADHMMREDFQDGIQELLAITANERSAIMCAERFFWKCHRRLLSDFLIVHGVAVEHILGPGNIRSHKLTTGAIITEEGQLVYPDLSFGS